MKSLGFVAMALCLFYGAYRYALQTDLVKQDFPEHIVCKGPVWLEPLVSRSPPVVSTSCILLPDEISKTAHQLNLLVGGSFTP
jgi:hypothetical protein